MATDEKTTTIKPADIVPLVIQALSEHGELETGEIVRLVQEEEPDAPEQTVQRAIIRLDRQGILTNTPGGYQVTRALHRNPLLVGNICAGG